MTGGQAWVAVLFDLDGVLVDSFELHRTVWHNRAQVHGLDPALVFEATFGRRPLDTIHEVAPHLTVEPKLARLGALLDAPRPCLTAVKG